MLCGLRLRGSRAKWLLHSPGSSATGLDWALFVHVTRCVSAEYPSTTYERKCQAHRSPFACGSRFSQDDLGAFECRQCGCSLLESLQHRVRRARSSSIWRQVSSQSRMGDSFCSQLQGKKGLSPFLGIFSPGRLSNFTEPPTLQSLPDSRSDRLGGG